MALRLKTIRYAWPVLRGPTTDATYASLGTITVFLPEPTRTIRAAYVIVHWQDLITSVGGTVAEWRVRMQVGAAMPSEVASTAPIAHTSENMAVGLGPIDFTTYFAANFGNGTWQTCALELYCHQSTGSPWGLANVTAELVLTYAYDDTATTQIKTIYIPLECPQGPLDPNNLTEIGMNQVPQLTGTGGFIREANPVIRDYYFVLEGNEQADAGTTDFTLGVAIDTEVEFAFYTTKRALGSDRFVRFIWSRTTDYPDPEAAHAFKARSAGFPAFRQLSIVLVITYEFNASTTTAVTNSILIPFKLPSPAATKESQHSRSSHELFVDEPGPVTLLQSAFRLHFQTPGVSDGLWARCGSQAFRYYALRANIVCGMVCLQQRIDAGSSQGAGLALARGSNMLNVDCYNSSTTHLVTDVSGVFILNYASGLHADGIGAHAHTVFLPVRAMSTTPVRYITVSDISPDIPESNYWVLAVGFWEHRLCRDRYTSAVFAVHVEANEAAGAGWRALYAETANTDEEVGEVATYIPAGDAFRRHPGDPDPQRLSLNLGRTYAMLHCPPYPFGVEQFLTYHALLFEFSGAITPNPGAGVAVDIHRAETGERWYVATTDAGGQFSVQVHHDALPLFAHVRVSPTAVGRSDNVLPGTPANIVIGSGTTGISRTRVQGDM